MKVCVGRHVNLYIMLMNSSMLITSLVEFPVNVCICRCSGLLLGVSAPHLYILAVMYILGPELLTNTSLILTELICTKLL